MTKGSTREQRLKTIEQRFSEKHGSGDGCWNWTSAIGSRGYGIFWHSKERKSLMAHRYALELFTGEEPDPSLVVMHSCDNPACVNPAHLSLGTIRDNAMDARRKGRLAFGERNGGGKKLTEDQVRSIIETKGKTSGSFEANRYGVARGTVNRIRRAQSWMHISGQ